MSRMLPCLVAALVLSLAGVSLAGVPDPQIKTDHPVYGGELTCSTLDRAVAEAYRVFAERYGHQPETDSEKLVALWIWQCEHHMHACDPYVYGGPGQIDAKDGWMETRDWQLGQFSFGFSLCYTIHAQFSALVGYALGDMSKTNCPNVPGHTPFEAFVDGKWALADMTTGMMVFDDDGKPMSIAEIIPHVPPGEEGGNKWTADPRRTGFGKFQMVPFGDNWAVYQAITANQHYYGYSAMPIVYSLRPGETFTRYFDPGLEDGKTWCYWGRDYYNIMGKPVHGPFRNVTFLDDPPVGNGRKGRGYCRYGNGVFEYAPSLTDSRYAEGLWGGYDKPRLLFAGGALRAEKGSADLILQHQSPYVIAATAGVGGEREWKAREEECVNGAIVTGRALGQVPVAISVDAGKTWQDVGKAWGDFRIDFTDAVKGRHFYLIRFGLTPDTGLQSLKLRTVTHMSRGVFPRLTDGGTKVTYQAGGQVAVHGGPSQYLAEHYRYTKLAEPGYRVYRIAAPGPIRYAAGVGRCNAEGESKGGLFGPWSVEFSIDGGKTWLAGMKDVMVAQSDGDVMTKDDSDWGGGRHAYVWAQKQFDGASKEVLFRFGKGNIPTCEVYATYEAPNSSNLEITYGWLEGGQARQHVHTISAGKNTDTWTVPTGKKVVNKWVRFEVK